jgi:hypothetical protein
VYLIGETNFLVDVDLQQDIRIKHLVELAMKEKITLVVPEISFFEVWGAILSKINRRKELAENLRKEANQINRSSYAEKTAKNLKESAKLLEESYDVDIYSLEDSLKILKQICTVIDYSPTIHTRSYLITLDKRYDLVNPDASIYESINAFAKENDGIKIHLNKNTDDFDKKIINKELNDLGVEVYFDSGKVIKKIAELVE